MDLTEQALRICMRELRGNDKRTLARFSMALWQHFDAEYRVHRRQRLKSYLSHGVKIKCVVHVDGQRHGSAADGVYAFRLYHISPSDLSDAYQHRFRSEYELYSNAIRARKLRYARKSATTGLYINYDDGRALELAQMYPVDSDSLHWMPLKYVRHRIVGQDPSLKYFRGSWYPKHGYQCYLLGYLPLKLSDDFLLLKYLQIVEMYDLPFCTREYIRPRKTEEEIIRQYNDENARNYKGGYLCHFK